MNRIVILIILLCCLGAGAQTSFTEFYCNSTGTNVNSGHTTNALPHFFVANADWDASTGVFTPGLDPSLSNVVIGDWASVTLDADTTGVFVGRVTATNSTTITVSISIATGIPPSTSASGRSIRIGGAWYGPWYSGATVDNLPFNFVNALLTNTSMHSPRINFKNDRVYTMTNTIATSNGPLRFEGYSTNAGDSALVTMSGSASGAAHNLLGLAGNNITFAYLSFATNGSTSTSALVQRNSASEFVFFRCVFRNCRQKGLDMGSGAAYLVECEFFSCNESSSANSGACYGGTGGFTAIRCIAHNNLGAGSSGFYLQGGFNVLIGCVAFNNGRNGFECPTTIAGSMMFCDAYNNSSNGVAISSTSASMVHIESCNFVKNGAYGVNSIGSTLRNGIILNCGFGSGTNANGAGDINTTELGGVDVLGTVTYAADVTPWVDPANGDFSINLAAAINAGRGQFLQTSPGYSGTIGYPDIGAAQATNDASGGTVIVAAPIVRR